MSNETRQPAGVPVGGQFATNPKTEPTVVLPDTMVDRTEHHVMDDNQRLDAIDARAAAATPGPWSSGEGTHGNPSDGPQYCEVYAMDGPIAELEWSKEGDADADFIANVPTDISWLVDQVKARDAALRDVLAVLDRVGPEASGPEHDDWVWLDDVNRRLSDITDVINAALTPKASS